MLDKLLILGMWLVVPPQGVNEVRDVEPLPSQVPSGSVWKFSPDVNYYNGNDFTITAGNVVKVVKAQPALSAETQAAIEAQRILDKAANDPNVTDEQFAKLFRVTKMRTSAELKQKLDELKQVLPAEVK